MPKSHRLADQATHFAISPWQCKRKHAEDSSTRGDHSEVVVALPPSKATKHPVNSTEGRAAGTVRTERNTNKLSGWRSKRQARDEAERPQQKDASYIQPLSVVGSPARADLPGPKHLHAQTAMSGAGYVAVLPDGQCIGEVFFQSPLHLSVKHAGALYFQLVAHMLCHATFQPIDLACRAYGGPPQQVPAQAVRRTAAGCARVHR